MATMIKISDETWEKINSIRKRGQTFDEVILNLIKTQEELNGEIEGTHQTPSISPDAFLKEVQENDDTKNKK